MDILITNNPLVYQKMQDKFDVDFDEGLSLLEVLLKTQSYIQKGHILLTHPLSGSIKPNETLYKSIVVSGVINSAGSTRRLNKDSQSSLPCKPVIDQDSLKLINRCISMLANFAPRHLPKEYHAEMQMIDYTLIK